MLKTSIVKWTFAMVIWLGRKKMTIVVSCHGASTCQWGGKVCHKCMSHLVSNEHWLKLRWNNNNVLLTQHITLAFGLVQIHQSHDNPSKWKTNDLHVLQSKIGFLSKESGGSQIIASVPLLERCICNSHKGSL